MIYFHLFISVLLEGFSLVKSSTGNFRERGLNVNFVRAKDQENTSLNIRFWFKSSVMMR